MVSHWQAMMEEDEVAICDERNCPQEEKKERDGRGHLLAAGEAMAMKNEEKERDAHELAHLAIVLVEG